MREAGHEFSEDMEQVERGETRPLADILAALRGKLPGEVIHVEIERHNGEWLNEFRGLSSAVIAHGDKAGWKSWEVTQQQRITPEEMKSKLNDL